MGKKSESSKPDRIPPPGDIAMVFGKNEQGVHILRRRGENAPLETGLLQPLVEGRPISGELISMRQRQDLPFLYDVKSEMPAPQHGPQHGPEDGAEDGPRSPGPSQVATDSYRKGWDAIWGPRGGSSSRDVN